MFTRRILARRLRWLRTCLLVGFIGCILDWFFTLRTLSLNTAVTPTRGPLATGERYFIAGIHWNNEEILRSHWIPAVLALARELGPENVFVSIAESGSWDNSKGALLEMQSAMREARIPHLVSLNETTHADELARAPTGDTAQTEIFPGWIQRPARKWHLRRIPYLARLRNQVLQPLYDEERTAANVTFDRILFLNDVVFKPQDVYTLLRTRGGDYATACSLDFSKPPAFYDTFALRDIEGHEAIMPTWPFFRSAESRHALITGHPVPVTSCWNGIVAMDATPFYHANVNERLSFRGVDDDLADAHVEGSECCLVHADNPLSEELGVWVNPSVRVGYSAAAYHAVNQSPWPFLIEVFFGIWSNRVRRWTTTPWFKERLLERRVEKWEDAHRRLETGSFCLIDETQVLAANGWAHI